MNFIRRWRHGAERQQEQLLVRLWTLNNLNADEFAHSRALALEAKKELKQNLKYLTGPEVERTIERTVSESEYTQQTVNNLRRQIRHARGE